MKKKILGIFIVLALVVCLFFVGSIVTMFLAPGLEIFGVRYIAKDISNCEETINLDDLSGNSIYIDTDSVPITINYTNYYTSQVQFTQKYIGLTKTKFDKADLDVSLDEQKNIYIKTKEIKKWLYAYKTSNNYFLTITLPVKYAMDKNLYVNSKSSKVNINGDVTFGELSVVTSEGLSVSSGKLIAETFKYHTSKMITIDDKISAKNYNLKSTGSSININRSVEGDIIAETKGGDIRFESCENFKATSGGGSIGSSVEGLNCINGSTTIKTNGGNVSLGNISVKNDLALCQIESTSGDIKITSMSDGIITSSRGDIDIDQARAIILNSKLGDINVNKVSNEVLINGKNGDVFLGDMGVVNNAKVYATTGKINVKNAFGYIDLQSESNSIYLENKSSQNIVLKAGRNITATGLMGKIDIYANGNINIGFSGVTDNVNIESGTKTDEISIDAGATSSLDIDYNILSTKGKKAKVYVGDDIIEEGSNLDTGIHEGKHLFKIKTSYAKVVLKLSI